MIRFSSKTDPKYYIYTKVSRSLYLSTCESYELKRDKDDKSK